MSNVIKLNDNAELHLPCAGASGLFRIFMNNYQVSMISSQPMLDASKAGEFYLSSMTSNATDDFSSWNIDISRDAARTLEAEGVTITKDAKEALSHE